jgi:hypothetical protein
VKNVTFGLRTLSYTACKNKLQNMFSSYTCFLQLHESVFFYMALISIEFFLAYFLSKKDTAQTLFSPIWKSLMKLQHEHQDNCVKKFFYTIYRISFSHNYHIEKSNVQAYISKSLFINETTTSHIHLYDLMWTHTQTCLLVVCITVVFRNLRSYSVTWKGDRWIGKDVEKSGHGLI